jgi:hypothetical protein
LLLDAIVTDAIVTITASNNASTDTMAITANIVLLLFISKPKKIS